MCENPSNQRWMPLAVKYGIYCVTRNYWLYDLDAPAVYENREEAQIRVDWLNATTRRRYEVRVGPPGHEPRDQ